MYSMLCFKWNIPWAHFPSLQIEDDAYQDDLGYSKGVLGKGGVAGPIRGPVVDKKTQVSISKRLQVRRCGTIYKARRVGALQQ